MATFTAYVEWDEDSRLFVGSVPSVTGAHSQGATLEELRSNLLEALALCVEEGVIGPDDAPTFVGLQQLEVAL